MSHPLDDPHTARVHLPGGTLLLGAATNPKIRFWQKALRQEQLHPLAAQGLRHGEDHAGPQLRAFLHCVGATSDHFADGGNPGAKIQQALKNRQIAAVFIPDPPIVSAGSLPTGAARQASRPAATRTAPRASFTRLAGEITVQAGQAGNVGTRTQPGLKSTDALGASNRRAPVYTSSDSLPEVVITVEAKRGDVEDGPRVDLSRMTPDERVDEMNWLAWQEMPGEVGAAFGDFLTLENAAKAYIAFELVAIANTNPISGFIVDVALAGVAFYFAKEKGLEGLKLMADSHALAREANTKEKMQAAKAIRIQAMLDIGAAGLNMMMALAGIRAAKGAARGAMASEEEAVASQAPTSTRRTGSSGATNSKGGAAAGNPEPTPATGKGPISSIARQKQDGHIAGTPQYKNRIKQGKPTSVFSGSREEADKLVEEAWTKGSSVKGDPNVRDFDFGRPVGTGPNGGLQSKVRVHMDSGGLKHGHPAGPETP